MQNRNHLSGFFAKTTGAAEGDDDWPINPFDIFGSSHSLSTTNSVLDIEYRGPHIGVSPAIRHTL